MNEALLKFWIRLQSVLEREEGQDLVEYALVVGLISIFAVTALKGVATSIQTVITNISSTLSGAA